MYSQVDFSAEKKGSPYPTNFEHQIVPSKLLTPFSKFLNGLSPISKISKEAFNEVSKFKSIINNNNYRFNFRN